jgi:hypothetical protein
LFENQLELDKKVALWRAVMAARAVRSVCENVGGGWGEIDREEKTDYQKRCEFGEIPGPPMMT